MLIDGTKTHARVVTRDEDSLLLDGVAVRNEVSFRKIIERHGPWIYGVTQVILGDRQLAEDIARETLLELWDRPGLFRVSTASLRENLRILARAKALDEVRSLYDASAASRRLAASGRSSAR